MKESLKAARGQSRRRPAGGSGGRRLWLCPHRVAQSQSDDQVERLLFKGGEGHVHTSAESSSYECRVRFIFVQGDVYTSAGLGSYGCRVRFIRVQGQVHTGAGSGSYGCRVRFIRVKGQLHASCRSPHPVVK